MRRVAQLLAQAGDLTAALQGLDDLLRQYPGSSRPRIPARHRARNRRPHARGGGAVRARAEGAARRSAAAECAGIHAGRPQARSWRAPSSWCAHALEVSPDNPAIQDSLGWVLFRRGKTAGGPARAGSGPGSNSGDGEIAAHYGEVLWKSGDEGQARYVWQQALNSNPAHEGLQATMTRLTGEDAASAEHAAMRCAAACAARCLAALLLAGCATRATAVTVLDAARSSGSCCSELAGIHARRPGCRVAPATKAVNAIAWTGGSAATLSEVQPVGSARRRQPAARLQARAHCVVTTPRRQALRTTRPRRCWRAAAGIRAAIRCAALLGARPCLRPGSSRGRSRMRMAGCSSWSSRTGRSPSSDYASRRAALGSVQLPRRIIATRDDLRLRLVVDRWQLGKWR